VRHFSPIGEDRHVLRLDHRPATAIVLTMDEVGLTEHSDRSVILLAFEADEVHTRFVVIAHNPNIQHRDIMYTAKIAQRCGILLSSGSYRL